MFVAGIVTKASQERDFSHSCSCLRRFDDGLTGLVQTQRQAESDRAAGAVLVVLRVSCRRRQVVKNSYNRV